MRSNSGCQEATAGAWVTGGVRMGWGGGWGGGGGVGGWVGGWVGVGGGWGGWDGDGGSQPARAAIRPHWCRAHLNLYSPLLRCTCFSQQLLMAALRCVPPCSSTWSLPLWRAGGRSGAQLEGRGWAEARARALPWCCCCL
jgi:hypothetical protein